MLRGEEEGRELKKGREDSEGGRMAGKEKTIEKKKWRGMEKGNGKGEKDEEGARKGPSGKIRRRQAHNNNDSKQKNGTRGCE